MRRLRPLFAVLLSLLLLGAQQAAFAHLIGHLAPAGAVQTTAGDDDRGHGEALTLSEVCATCVSAAGLASGAPCGVSPRLTFRDAVEAPIAAATSALPSCRNARYRARAPPAIL